MNNKILITGADGNLGRQIIDVVDKLNYNYLGISRTKSRHNIIKCDITNSKQISKIIMKFKPSIIIHLAGPGGNVECQNDPKNAISVNVLGTLNILEASKKINSKIIFASTREVYGNSIKKISEKMKLKPKNINGVTKMLAENLILSYSKENKNPYIILRFTNFYGETYADKGISGMIKKSITGEKILVFGGQQKIDLIHFNDVVKIIIKAIDYKKSEIFNIGSGESISILSLIKKIEKISGKKIGYKIKKYRAFECKKIYVNIEKAKKELDFKTSMSLEDNLKRFVEHYA